MPKSLHIEQYKCVQTLSCLIKYSFFAKIGHPEVNCSIISSYCLHNRHLLSNSYFKILFLKLLLLLLLLLSSSSSSWSSSFSSSLYHHYYYNIFRPFFIIIPIFLYINYSCLGKNQGFDCERNVTPCSLLRTSAFRITPVSVISYDRCRRFFRNVDLSLYTA